MGVEVAEPKLAHVPGETAGQDSGLLNENGKINEVVGHIEPIKFGSHGSDEVAKGETNKAAEVSFPKDAVDEWPAPQQIHTFYFVKYRSYEDQKLKIKLDQVDSDLTKKTQARSQLIEKLRNLKADRAQKISLLKALNEENKQYRSLIDEKKKEREPLQQALGQLHGGKERGSGICSSVEELDYRIKSLQYRMQHESIPLTEEKQILREIKQLEGTREKVVANAAMRAKIQESMGEKEALEDQMKLIRVDMDGVRKDQQVVFAKRKQLEEEKDIIEKAIKSLEEELTTLTQKRDQTYESIKQLRKQREEGNSAFHLNRSLLNQARVLAEKKDVEALKELSDTEIDKFISQWNSSKAFREDYEKRILSSLDNRQLSRDGRMRNYNEKPILVVEKASPPETEAVSRVSAKQAPKEDSSSLKPEAAAPVQKEKKEKQKESNKIKGNSSKAADVVDEEDFYVPEKVTTDPPKVIEVDEKKLKEMRRAEEIEKAKLAMERKKKLSEKAAQKAAIKAQKEAEKKLKDREKRAKKKAGLSGDAPEAEEQTEAVTADAGDELAEAEKAEERVETPAPSKNKERKDNPVRRKVVRSRGSDALPRAILKRKKAATNYWMWAAPAALVLVLLISVGQGRSSKPHTATNKLSVSTTGMWAVPARLLSNGVAALRCGLQPNVIHGAVGISRRPLLLPFTTPFKSPALSICHLAQASKTDTEVLLRGVGDKDTIEDVKRVLELATRAATRREILHTGFLTPPVLNESMKALQNLAEIKMVAQGGYPEAERCRLSVGHPDVLTTDPDIVAALSISGNFGFQPCSHGDFLGSILGSGITRDKVGDIIVQGESGAHVLVVPELVDYLISSLDKVGNVSVTCKRIPLLAIEYEPPSTKSFISIESSVRLDSVASAGFKISRSKMVSLISNGDVRVNWSTVTKSSNNVKTGDIVSVSGKGRMKVGDIKPTKKGKFAVEIIRYK
ncbi:OLC1v1023074C1 [Oldenlandia corymbosa var. corymbosa]|uniref:OLC1v1023074C1 n=1 Tax=Oldenlandia corymbosa var. corymbosa TaxID=529605 RepID=A0AAV1BZV4_OLDCO|nr:OLC1v1023074C1 [Oldenlandia corymbosa var. corymbosa]